MHQIFRLKTNVSGQVHLMPAPPAKALNEVCQQLVERDVSLLVSLLADEDIRSLALQDEPVAAAGQGLEFTHFPIVDFGLPEPVAFRVLVSELCAALERGTSIAIHCRAGIGRTGTLASCILKGLGHPSEDAMERVAAARGMSIPDTESQRQFIQEFQPDR